jgi:ABC-type branched-subunit amino acid transport system ATPase component
VQAQVVRAALQERDTRRAAKRARDHRQVAVEELVLERARAGRDDDLPAREQRRHEIGEGLAGARAGLDRERAAARERGADPVGHELLLAA